MSIVPFRPRSLTAPASAESPPYAQFTGLRGAMLGALKAWLETDPPADLAAQEIEATASAMRQMNELLTKASA